MTPPPRDPRRELEAVWTELLGHDDFGYDDAFFDVGGHSLQVVRMRNALRERFPEVVITPVDIYRAATINKLAAHIHGETHDG